jgi:hypothetical protein
MPARSFRIIRSAVDALFAVAAIWNVSNDRSPGLVTSLWQSTQYV